LRAAEQTASQSQRRCSRSRFIGEPSTVIVANEALHLIVQSVQPLTQSAQGLVRNLEVEGSPLKRLLRQREARRGSRAAHGDDAAHAAEARAAQRLS
jgi:hypothetical protein